MSLRLTVLLAAALFFCGCYDRHSEPADDWQHLTPNCTVASLRALCSERPWYISDGSIIGGRVTSSDLDGNFYLTFTMSDATGGAEIMAGRTYTCNICPVGSYVAVRLHGCIADIDKGVLRIGLADETGAMDYFSSKVEFDSRVVRDGTVVAPDIPVLTFDALDADRCGMLVKIENLRCVPASGDAPLTWANYVRFEDADGNAVYTYTRTAAVFASEPLPAGAVSLTGILQYGTVYGESGNFYILKMRSLEDCSDDN